MEFSKTLEAAKNGSKEDLGKVLEACRSYMTLVADQRIPRALRGQIRPSSLVQEAYLRACKGVEDFHGKTEAQLAAWLRQILFRCLLSTLEHRPKSVTLMENTPDEAEETPLLQAVNRECADALYAAIERLPPHYRLAVELHHFHGLSFGEIGETLECSSEAARKLWVRAQYKLGQAMAQYR